MKRRTRGTAWARSVERNLRLMSRMARTSGQKALAQTWKPLMARRSPPAGAGTWTSGIALGPSGMRRFRLYRPPGVRPEERLPLMVMLHGCGQDADSFATSTRMNQVAMRGRFLVLYPEQDRMANGHGCWNWFDTHNGRAQGEVALILRAIDQVCLLHPVDRTRVAVVGLSAGASMAGLLAARHPQRFRAVVMHSGVAPGSAHSSLSAMSAMRGHRPAVPVAPARPVLHADRPALLVIQGDADAVVSPHNGQACAQAWARTAGARAGVSRSVQRGNRYAMSVTDYKRAGGTVATLVAVQGLGHAWSGGAAGKRFSDGQGPDASRMAWAFAARQFRS